MSSPVNSIFFLNVSTMKCFCHRLYIKDVHNFHNSVWEVKLELNLNVYVWVLCRVCAAGVTKTGRHADVLPYLCDNCPMMMLNVKPQTRKLQKPLKWHRCSCHCCSHVTSWRWRLAELIISLSFDLRYGDRRSSWMWIGGKDGTKRANHSAFLGRGTSGYSVGFCGWFRRLRWIFVKPTKWQVAGMIASIQACAQGLCCDYFTVTLCFICGASYNRNKFLAPFFIPEANIFVPYVLDFLFLIYVAIVSESPSRDLLKSASYIEAIIVFLSLMNKKKLRWKKWQQMHRINWLYWTGK